MFARFIIIIFYLHIEAVHVLLNFLVIVSTLSLVMSSFAQLFLCDVVQDYEKLP